MRSTNSRRPADRINHGHQFSSSKRYWLNDGRKSRQFSDFVPGPVYNDVAPPPVTSPPLQMVAFLPPGPPPTAPAAPPYPPPPLLNYMPPPAFPPMALQPPISGQFEDLTQTPELYQGQGGITYYSTQSQNALPRPNPPRRVKLAIPIVPPPAHDKSPSGSHKQRGGPSKQQEVPSVAS
ncbi:hypothetical protein J6590_033020 [Homalodisca vitripennis]|nr:hypothetical protein J6590_033020 [Homalodisca vitripennis]